MGSDEKMTQSLGDSSTATLVLALNTGFPQALEIMENLKNHKKVPCMEKSCN